MLASWIINFDMQAGPGDEGSIVTPELQASSNPMLAHAGRMMTRCLLPLLMLLIPL